jgi:hypothetical protein
VNESEGSLYNVLRANSMTQRIQQVGASRRDGGRQTIFCLDSMIIIIV